MNEMEPVADRLEVLLKRWPILVASFVLGGVAGWILGFVLPSRYMAAASIAVNIDYGRTQPLELIVEDRVLDRVYQFVTSDATLTEVSGRLQDVAGSNPVWRDLESLRDQTRLDQRLARWELIGFANEAEQAAVIANTWAEVTLDLLAEAQLHAWKAVQLQGISWLVQCISLQPISTPEEDYWHCVVSGLEASPEELDVLRSEVEASHGILPNLTFELIEAAQPIASPVLWRRGSLVLAGGIVGLIVGAAIAIGSGSRKTVSR